MVSESSVLKRITKETSDEIERIRRVISKDLGIDLDDVKSRHAEIVLRVKASRGNVNIKEIQDIMIGRIK